MAVYERTRNICRYPKKHQGDIIGFKTSKGYRKALMEVEKGAVASVHVVTERDGERYNRDLTSNLDQLPLFS
ncbi:DUF3892 domain-containing protein [Parageobacillus thermoglucosidasius]|uniref:DUF3892 domain-containing protein n=1 Tax=Parageobacillus thermoglucosidasius TaxID=1426 RepID=UPI000FF9C691|nr:hypothetical protein PTHTG4_18400 [Parageobacillus thermoglucosidasius]GMO00620.1 hypothetical protein PthstB1num2_26590 [Parageobacillus thermoglucosidasius]